MNTTISIEITDSELDSLNTAIFTKYGYDFSNYEKTSFKRRIQRILYKYEMNSMLDLWRKILFDKEFFLEMKDEISVGMTEMFRNPDFWQKIASDIIPKFEDKPALDIWHAGCATGEEIYSMAILLYEKGILKKTRALATDLSDNFVTTATKGQYDSESIERYSKNYLEYNPNGIGLRNYLSQVGDEGFIIRDFLKDYDCVKQQNLVTEPMTSKFDIIFCRNVMIYFNDELKLKVLKMFNESLKPGGLLCIGYFDALPHDYEQYFEYEESSLKLFRKIEQN
jgi:chemotaxis protein methyltransferase CheR